MSSVLLRERGIWQYMETLNFGIPRCSTTLACYRLDFTPTEDELSDVEQRFAVEGCGKRLVIPENFSQTLSPYSLWTIMLVRAFFQ